MGALAARAGNAAVARYLSSGGGAVVARAPGTAEPAAPAAPAAPAPGGAPLTPTGLITMLLTPTKLVRVGNMIQMGEHFYSAEPAVVRSELEKVYAERQTRRDFDGYVTALTDLLAAPANIVEAGAPAAQPAAAPPAGGAPPPQPAPQPAAAQPAAPGSGPATPELADQIRTAVLDAQQKMHEDDADFLVTFKREGVRQTLDVLAKSKEQVEKERERYGIKDDSIRLGGHVLWESASMADNADSAKLRTAISELHKRYVDFRIAEGQGGLSIYGPNNKEQVDKTRLAYNEERARAEAAHPIIASFNLDLSRGDELEGAMNRLADDPAPHLANEIAEKLANIEKSSDNIQHNEDRVYSLPSVASLTKVKLAVAPRSHLDAVVDERMKEAKEDQAALQMIPLIMLGLGLMAAPATGGASLVLVPASSVVAGGLALETIRQAMLRQAETGTDFQKAHALAQDAEAPDWLWVATDLVAAALDLGAAATELRVFVQLRREAQAARAAAAAGKDTKAAEAVLDRLRDSGNAAKPGLGDRMKADVMRSPVDPAAAAAPESKLPSFADDAPPSSLKPPLGGTRLPGMAGYSKTFADEVEAMKHYNELLHGDVMREVGMAHCPETGQWAVMQGTVDEILPPNNMFLDQQNHMWTIMRHEHPGNAGRMRLPSAADFDYLERLHTPPVTAANPTPVIEKWESVAGYDNPILDKRRLSYYGYDPAEAEPYYIRYMSPAAAGPGELRVKRFKLGPHTPLGEPMYLDLVRQVDAEQDAAMAEFHGAPTKRY